MSFILLQVCPSAKASPPMWTYIVPVVSASIAFVSIVISFLVFRMQRQMTQRQLIVPLWQYISSLNEIDPDEPITPDIIKAINTLELIALSCEGNMVDSKIMNKTFSEQFITHYENIERCEVVPGYKVNRSGMDLIKENRAMMSYYAKLKKAKNEN